MNNKDEIPQWAEAEATITMRRVEWLGIFKRRYLWLMLFSGDYWRESTAEEKERGIYPGRSIWDTIDLDEYFPIFDENHKPKPQKKEKHITPDWVRDRKIYMGLFEVSPKDYRKYRKAKKVLIQFELQNFKHIKVLKTLELLK